MRPTATVGLKVLLCACFLFAIPVQPRMLRSDGNAVRTTAYGDGGEDGVGVSVDHSDIVRPRRERRIRIADVGAFAVRGDGDLFRLRSELRAISSPP